MIDSEQKLLFNKLILWLTKCPVVPNCKEPPIVKMQDYYWCNYWFQPHLRINADEAQPHFANPKKNGGKARYGILLGALWNILHKMFIIWHVHEHKEFSAHSDGGPRSSP